MKSFFVGDLRIDLIDPDPCMVSALSDAKVNLSLASPLFSYTLTRVDVIGFSNLHPTACAVVHDEISAILLNPDFFLNCLKSAEERAFVLYHELDHIFFGHVQRMNEMGYDRKLWNDATDYYINLNASGVFKDPVKGRVLNERYRKYMKIPDGLLYDEKFLGMSSDEIYEILKKSESKQNKNDPKSDGTESGSEGEQSENSGSSSSDTPGSGEGSKEGDGDDSQGGSAGGGDRGDGESPTGGSEGSQGGSQEVVGGKFDAIMGNGGSKEKILSNEQALKAAATFAELQDRGSSNVSNSFGESMLIARIRNLRKPEVPWTEKLETNIRHRIKSRYTYSKWSPLSATNGGVIFPSKTGEVLKIVFGVDTSGSMRMDDYIKALSELKGMLDGFDAWEVEYVQCDTTLNVIGRFTSEDELDILDWASAVFGGFGTHMSPIVRHAQDLYHIDGEEFDAVIILTDGFLMENDVDNAVEPDQNVIVVSTRNNELTLEKAQVLYLNRGKI